MSAITVASNEYLDYTPVTDFPAGQVIVVGEVVGYAEQPLKNGIKGALRIFGEVELNAETAAIGQGALLYWDAGNSRVTTTASTHKKAGIAAADKALNATRIRVKLGMRA